MAGVSETIVREYFELNGFFVRQQRKYVPHPRSVDEVADFFVINPEPQPAPNAAPIRAQFGECAHRGTRGGGRQRLAHRDLFSWSSHARTGDPAICGRQSDPKGRPGVWDRRHSHQNPGGAGIAQDAVVREQSIALLRSAEWTR